MSNDIVAYARKWVRGQLRAPLASTPEADELIEQLVAECERLRGQVDANDDYDEQGKAS